ncbi:MAG: 2OG-Fe(II) oxygenase [Vicinamibacterales bacterium]
MAEAARGTLLRATRRGWQFTADPLALQAAHVAFVREHLLRLPQLFDAALLGVIRRRLVPEAFRTRVATGVYPPATDLKLADDVTHGLLHFLLNDPAVVAAIRTISGRPEAGGFVGAVYRLLPGAGHRDSWHDDCDGNRLVGLTVNLGEQPFAGGELELRQKGATAPLAVVANTGPGDGVLFAVDLALEHRVAPITGSVPKTALAGWFCRDPDARF